MAVPKLIAMIVMIVFCLTTMGLMGGLISAFKKKDQAKEKSIGISFAVFFVLTFIAYKVMGMMP
jgi:uncharacterized membrane protein YhfC